MSAPLQAVGNAGGYDRICENAINIATDARNNGWIYDEFIKMIRFAWLESQCRIDSRDWRS
jgi:hypothetical protein